MVALERRLQVRRATGLRVLPERGEERRDRGIDRGLGLLRIGSDASSDLGRLRVEQARESVGQLRHQWYSSCGCGDLRTPA